MSKTQQCILVIKHGHGQRLEFVRLLIALRKVVFVKGKERRP